MRAALIFVESGNATAVRFLLQHGDVISTPLAAASHVLNGDREAFIADIHGHRADLLAKIGEITLGEYAITYGSTDSIQALLNSGLVPWHEFDEPTPNGSANAVDNVLLSAALHRELYNGTMRGLCAATAPVCVGAIAFVGGLLAAYGVDAGFGSLYPRPTR